MHCPSCGEEVASGDEYCWHCGEEFPGGLPRRKTDSNETRRENDRSERTDKNEPKTASSTDETTMAALTHLLGLFTWILGPVVVYLVTEDDYVKKNAANALNWQVSLTIYFFVSAILVIILVGFLLIFLLSILNLVFCVVAAVKAADGEVWEYPFAISFA